MIVLKMAEFSTAHLTKTDAEILEEGPSFGCTLSSYPEGFFISVGDEYVEEVMKEMDNLYLSKNLQGLRGREDFGHRLRL